jgi:MFS family permease
MTATATHDCDSVDAPQKPGKIPFGIFGVTFFLAINRGFFFSSDVIFFFSKGISFAQFSLLEVISSILIALCEAPTGVIADRYGRKVSVMISCVLRTAIFMVLFATANFGVIMLAYAFLGIAMTFQSGALNGWFASLCQRRGHTSLERPFLQLYNYQLAGAAGGGLLTAALAGFGAGVVVLGAAASCFAALLVCIATPDAPVSRDTSADTEPRSAVGAVAREARALWTHSREAAVYVAGSRELRLVLVFKILVILAACGTFKTWQPIMERHFPDNALVMAGLSWAAFVGCSMAGNWLSGALGRYSVRDRLILSGALAGIPLIGAALLGSGWLALALWGIYIAFDAVKYPLLDATVHENAPDSHRSSVESLLSLVEGTLEIFGYLLIAAVAFKLDMIWPIVVGAGLLHLASAAFVYLRWRS